MGVANAFSNAIGQGTNLYMQNQYLNALRPQLQYVPMTYEYASRYGQGSL
jgi:hypothetical protein